MTFEYSISLLKHEKLPSTNSTKSGAHKKIAKIQENEHTPGPLVINCYPFSTELTLQLLIEGSSTSLLDLLVHQLKIRKINI